MDKPNFKIGDKVVCIEDKKYDTKLKKGNVYEIEDIRKDRFNGEYFVTLLEIPGVSYFPRRFKKVNSKFRKIFENLKEEVK